LKIAFAITYSALLEAMGFGCFFYGNAAARLPVANLTDKSDNFLEILEDCPVARVAAC